MGSSDGPITHRKGSALSSWDSVNGKTHLDANAWNIATLKHSAVLEKGSFWSYPAWPALSLSFTGSLNQKVEVETQGRTADIYLEWNLQPITLIFLFILYGA